MSDTEAHGENTGDPEDLDPEILLERWRRSQEELQRFKAEMEKQKADSKREMERRTAELTELLLGGKKPEDKEKEQKKLLEPPQAFKGDEIWMENHEITSKDVKASKSLPSEWKDMRQFKQYDYFNFGTETRNTLAAEGMRKTRAIKEQRLNYEEFQLNERQVTAFRVELPKLTGEIIASTDNDYPINNLLTYEILGRPTDAQVDGVRARIGLHNAPTKRLLLMAEKIHAANIIRALLLEKRYQEVDILLQDMINQQTQRFVEELAMEKSKGDTEAAVTKTIQENRKRETSCSFINLAAGAKDERELLKASNKRGGEMDAYWEGQRTGGGRGGFPGAGGTGNSFTSWKRGRGGLLARGGHGQRGGFNNWGHPNMNQWAQPLAFTPHWTQPEIYGTPTPHPQTAGRGWTAEQTQTPPFQQQMASTAEALKAWQIRQANMDQMAAAMMTEKSIEERLDFEATRTILDRDGGGNNTPATTNQNGGGGRGGFRGGGRGFNNRGRGQSSRGRGASGDGRATNSSAG